MSKTKTFSIETGGKQIAVIVITADSVRTVLDYPCGIVIGTGENAKTIIVPYGVTFREIE